METTEIPAARYLSRSATRFLSPAFQPPPWMKNRSGVGCADAAFQKSRTFRSCPPYFTSAMVGVGNTGAAAFFVAAAFFALGWSADFVAGGSAANDGTATRPSGGRGG